MPLHPIILQKGHDKIPAAYSQQSKSGIPLHSSPINHLYLRDIQRLHLLASNKFIANYPTKAHHNENFRLLNHYIWSNIHRLSSKLHPISYHHHTNVYQQCRKPGKRAEDNDCTSCCKAWGCVDDKRTPGIRHCAKRSPKEKRRRVDWGVEGKEGGVLIDRS